MNILITAPSLNESENVSGISTIVRTIINNNKTSDKFFHFRLGNNDGQIKGLKWIIVQITLLPRLFLFIHKYRIDIIHLNTDFTRTSLIREFVILSCFKLLIKRPILLHIHGGNMLMKLPKCGSFYWHIIKQLLKGSNVNIVLSDKEQDQLYNNFGVSSMVLPNALAPLLIKPGCKRFNEKIKFIFLGKIVITKGIYIIAEALKLLSEYHDDFNFTFYGSGPDLSGFLNKLNEIRTLQFEYKGVAKGAEKWKAFNDANVFLLPSYFEGLPLAMLEAMQSGCIPVVSDEASMLTVVQDSVNGFVVKKGNPQELSTLLEEILNERNKLEQMSNSAKITIAEKYGISTYMKSLTSYYAIISNQVLQ